MTRYLIAGFFCLGIMFVLPAQDTQGEESHDVHAETEVVHEEAAAHDEIAHNEHEAHPKFEAGKMIMEHIGDAHELHFWGSHKHPVTMPLPVIIYQSGEGFKTFLSSKFEHGHVNYEGYAVLKEEIVSSETGKTYFKGKLAAMNPDGTVNESRTAAMYDLSITKNVVAIILSIILLMLIMTSVAKSYKKREGQAPKGLQSFIEPIILFIRDEVAKPAIGEKKYAKFMPYLLTIFFFIWINNIMGLIPLAPFGANVTGNVAVPIVLALFTFVITTINGNSHYWRHVFAMPGVPLPVLLIVTPIEIIGVFLKPLVLVIRLFANITAGHIVLLVFFSLIFMFGETSAGVGYGVAIPSVLFTLLLNTLELLVGAIQAYVFTLLSAIYFGMAVVDDGHH